MVQVKDKVEYIIALINEFAKRFKLTDVQAYRYIAHYKGITFQYFFGTEKAINKLRKL